MRRLILEDPLSRSAIWSRNLAVFALLVALIGIALSRKGLGATESLAIVGAAMGLAALSILSAFVAMAVIWRTGFRGVGLAFGGLALSALLLVYPTYVAVQARTVPLVADISTDLDDPPTFLATQKAMEARRGAMPPPMSEADKDLEARVYPDLDTLTIDDDADEVAATIRRIVAHHRWQIVDEVAPTDGAAGHLDVVVKSLVMGFPADLTIRIRDAGDQTKVDIRSVARTAWQEPGSNAARVQSLIDEIDAASDRS